MKIEEQQILITPHFHHLQTKHTTSLCDVNWLDLDLDREGIVTYPMWLQPPAT